MILRVILEVFAWGKSGEAVGGIICNDILLICV